MGNKISLFLLVLVLTATLSTTLIEVRAADFDLDVSPTYRRVRAGESAHFTVTLITITPGYSNDVYLRALFEPPAVSVTFSDNPLNPTGDTDSDMVVRTSVYTPPGVYTITVRGRDPVTDQNVYVDITLEVLPPHEPEFELSISPSSLTVKRGEKAEFTVQAAPFYGFNHPIYLSLICPACASHSFDPNPMCPGSASCGCPALPCYTYTSTLTIDTSAMDPGSYSIVVEGCYDGYCDRAYATLTVEEGAGKEEVNLIVYPVTVKVKPGDTFHIRVTVGITGGEASEPLTLRVTPPPGWYIGHYPTELKKTSHLDLWVTVPKVAGPGTYGMSVELYKGEELLKSRQIMVLVERTARELVVNVKPNRVTLTPDSPEAELVVFLESTDVTEAVLTLVGIPSGVSYSLPAKLKVGEIGSINLTLENAPPGEYRATLIARGEDGCCVNTTDVTVEVRGATGQATQTSTVTQQTQQTQTVEPETVTVTKTLSEVRTVTVEAPQLDPTILGLGIVGMAAVISAIYLLRRRPPAVPASVEAA